MADLRYPIGEFALTGDITPARRQAWIDDIAQVPTQLRSAVQGLSEAQLDTPYRAGGWTVRQVVHHLADVNLNTYVRFRLALTEEEPRVSPYGEKRWAELSDARTAPVALSLELLEALHARWVLLLRALGEDDFARAFQHSERGRVTLAGQLARSSWHARHHLAHITTLRQRMGW